MQVEKFQYMHPFVSHTFSVSRGFTGCHCRDIAELCGMLRPTGKGTAPQEAAQVATSRECTVQAGHCVPHTSRQACCAQAQYCACSHEQGVQCPWQ